MQRISFCYFHNAANDAQGFNVLLQGFSLKKRQTLFYAQSLSYFCATYECNCY